MIPWLAIGGGLALLKYLGDSKKEAADRQMKVAEYQAAPYTGHAPTTQIQRSDLFGNVLQGAAMGAGMGQSAAALNGASGASPWMGMGGAPQGPSLMPEAYGQNPFGVSSSADLLKSARGY